MSEQTFKSPNFFEREIDLSAPTTSGPSGIPATVIGPCNKGPAFIPVTVANFGEFNKIFGNLDPKYYGPYAVKEYIEAKGLTGTNTTSLTYIRVLGAGANSQDSDLFNTTTYGTVKNAGFVLDGNDTGTVHYLAAKHSFGAHEPTSVGYFSDNDSRTGANEMNLVRGMIMVPHGARIMVTGSNCNLSSGQVAATDDAKLYDGKFKLIISSALGSSFSKTDGINGVRVLTASFDPSSKDYFGKILNTDPDKFWTEQHYLHADFPVDQAVAYVKDGDPLAVLSGSSNMSSADKTYLETFGSFNARFSAPKTSYFISQPFGSTEFDLFRFEALDDGEYANSLYKISISNIKVSAAETEKYGTFNVQIREFGDSDLNPVVLEQYTNCSLDPNSKNYIAKLIGDRKAFYNFDTINPDEKRIVAMGNYPNVSRLVRVVMSDEVSRGQVPPEAIPFGFRSPSIPKLNPNVSDNLALSSSDSRLYGKMAEASFLSSSFLPPIPYRFKVTRGEIAGSSFIGEPGPSEKANPSFYWGVKFERNSITSDPSAGDKTVLNPNVIPNKNGYIKSLTKFYGIDKLDALLTGSSADSFNNNKFTLANVALYNTSVSELTSSVNNHMREAAYVRNAKLDSTTYTFTENSRHRLTFASLLSQGTAPEFNRFSGFMKFTNIMYGGFDGTNFLDRDARRLNDKSTSFEPSGGANSNYYPLGFNSTNPSGFEVDNNGVVSYLSAVDISTNPVESNSNIIVIPGIREQYVNAVTMKKVRDYGLAIHIMDIPAYDDDANRIYEDSSVKPNINYTCSTLDTRAVNNNYVATYFPDVYIDDETNRRKVKVPASVAAMSALSYNDKSDFPWFAPAGFNRAALNRVSNVDVRLNVSDRDRLYESRINPIATFPRLGYVIYGQKTLQANKSALDRVNVRRLMIEIKRQIIDIANRIVFEQNTPAVRNKFVADASLALSLIQINAGIEAFQVVMNESNNTQQDVDLNRLNGRIVVVPTRVIEFIAIDFIVTNSGVQFV